MNNVTSIIVIVVSVVLVLLGYADRMQGLVVAGAILFGSLMISAAIRGGRLVEPSAKRGFDVIPAEKD